MRRDHKERGFALITTLWLVAMLSSLVGLGLAATRLGVETSTNRVRLAQGRWAAEACLAIVETRWVAGSRADTGTIDLGQGKACAWRVEDPTARLNVNVADPTVLKAWATLAGQPGVQSVVAAILERRQTMPFESLAELAGVGADTVLIAELTVDGPGSVNVNAASDRVLHSLPGLTGEAVDLVRYRRSVGRPIESLDALAGALSPSSRETLLAHYAELARAVTFAAPQLLVTAEGWVGAEAVRRPGLESRIEVLLVPLPERLAVIRRRLWW